MSAGNAMIMISARELALMERGIAELSAKLDVVMEKLGGAAKANETVGVGLEELAELLRVDDWKPGRRTVANWIRKYRHTLHRVTQRPLSFSRASVMDTLAWIHAGKKKPAVNHGGTRL